MPKIGWCTDPRCLDHLEAGHPERPARLERLLAVIEETDSSRLLEPIPARPVDDDLLRRVHSADQIALVGKLSRTGGRIDGDTYVSVGSDAIARLAAGGVVACVDAVRRGSVKRAFVAVRPPGHHATPDRSMGFCLYNNVAIGARFALDSGMARVAIVDWDVHHGNGTQDIFYDTDRVLFCSTHQYPLYPGTGAAGEIGSGAGRGFTVNAPLPPYTGNDGFLRVFDEIIVPVIRRARPDLLFVSAGFDAHYLDPLASLQLTTGGFHALARRLTDVADEVCEGRLVACLEGGYDLGAIAWSALAMIHALAGEPMFEDPLKEPATPEASVSELVPALRLLHGLGPDA